MKFPRNALALSVAVGAAAIVFLAAAVFLIMPNRSAGAQEESVIRVAGTARCQSNGTWAVLSDSAHAPIGNPQVTSTTSTDVRISYTPGTKVRFMLAGPDETLAAKNITVGASAGLSYSVFRLGNSAGSQLNPKTCMSWAGTSGNFWFVGELTSGS